MLRSDSFFELLNDEIKKTIYKPEIIKRNCEMLNKTYDIPLGILTDYLTLRTPIDDASEFILYTLSKVYLREDVIKEYFSNAEIKKFSKTKYKKKELEWPLIFDMIEIKSNQWIGKIMAQQLMELRDSQMINYNERTQRTMERKIYYGHEVYQIAINDVAVKAIEKSYEEDSYIPNTLTLNIPDETEADFYYNPENHKLIINSLDYFDILDGYHRYRALSKVYTKNKDFDYEMELRIVSFSEEHARQFIWQEDQKTQMSKLDSESYNQSDYSVYICERLANSMSHGIISRNKGIIDFPELAMAIKVFYCYKHMKRSGAMKVIDEIKRKLDKLIEEDPEIIDKKWKRSFIYCVICVLNQNDQDFAKYSYLLYEESKGGIYNKNYWGGNYNSRKATDLIELLKDIKKKEGR